MAQEREIRDLRYAVGRGLSSCLAVETETPERLLQLLRQLKRSEESMRCRTAMTP
jgi:hypothetical protein